MNLDRLSQHKEPSTSTVTSKMTRGLDTNENIIFNPNCIFCNSTERKNVKEQSSWTQQGLSVFEREEWKNVLTKAEENPR